MRSSHGVPHNELGGAGNAGEGISLSAKQNRDSLHRVDILNKSLNGNDATGSFDPEGGNSLSSIGRNYG